MIPVRRRGDGWMGSPVSNESRKVDLGSHALRVRESGAGTPVFVCLHGFLDGPAVWDGVAQHLAEIGRVVLVEQRAHGHSTAPDGPCGLDDLGRDVLRLLDALEVPRAILVGHALGGIAALEVALAAPERVAALALIATPSEIDERTAMQWRHVVRGGEVNKLQGLARSVFGPTSRREVDGDGGGLTEIARAMQEFHSRPLTPRLGALRCPTVVVAGAADAAGVAAARGLAARIAGATVEVVGGQGDAPHVGAPAEVAAVLRSLSARLPQA
jgi:pimeloyl-ACP methyl ester carboxylesterase